MTSSSQIPQPFKMLDYAVQHPKALWCHTFDTYAQGCTQANDIFNNTLLFQQQAACRNLLNLTQFNYHLFLLSTQPKPLFRYYRRYAAKPYLTLCAQSFTQAQLMGQWIAVCLLTQAELWEIPKPSPSH